MTPHFRRAQSFDAGAIDRLYRSFVQNPDIKINPATIDAIKDDPSQILIVGEVDGQVIATAFLVICRDVMFDDQPFAVLENIVVDSHLRSHGVGRKLMGFLREECRSRRCTKIMLLSSSSRTEAHKFFESCGYRGDVKRGFVNYINR